MQSNIKDKLKTINGIDSMSNLLIVFNGEFLTSRNKYVYLDGTKDIRIYVNDYKTHKRQNIDSKLNNIESALVASSLFGVETEAKFTLDDCYFAIDSELGMLFMESALYHTVKQTIRSKKKGNFSIHLGNSADNVIDSTTVKSLENAFNRRGLTNYINFALSTSILRKVNKKNKFYTIQKTFVPLMVTSKYVYNPILENDDYHFQTTDIYNTMKDQWVEILPNNVLGVYLLTHKQICECLHMKKFMRFSSQVAYAVIAGLLNPTFAELPSVQCKTVVAPKANDPTINLKRSYSREEYALKCQELSDKIRTSTGEIQMRARLDLEVLQSYVERDSLFALCILNRNILANIGPTSLDSSKDTTETKFYEYLREAKLWA